MAKALLSGLMSIKEIRCSTAAFDCTTFASSSTRSATKSYEIDTAKSVKFVAPRESVTASPL
jgi:hypothetical protein